MKGAFSPFNEVAILLAIGGSLKSSTLCFFKVDTIGGLFLDCGEGMAAFEVDIALEVRSAGCTYFTADTVVFGGGLEVMDDSV